MHSVTGSDSGHESIGFSLVGRESLASSTKKSLAGNLSISARLSNFKVSMAYEPALHKKKCGLCEMYYDRDTVKYKVPNHRIFDLQNSWAEKQGVPTKREGRRFQSASFLYTDTTVCSFCSQFFWLLNEELDAISTNKSDTPVSSSSGPKLNVITEFDRADVSQCKRSYQSSEVDNRSAIFAILPPFEASSKTRREADPWWEVDLGRQYELSKIDFKITVHVRQEFSVYVMLLQKPVGFEDPFLDSVCTKAREIKIYSVAASNSKRQESLSWSLPPNCSCFAIRIQIKGIHILELQQFQAFLGDKVILETPEDANVLASSFASLDPRTIRAGLQEMMSPQKKLEKIPKVPSPPKDKDKIYKVSEDAVKILSQRINTRYSTLGDWKDRVLEFCKMFSVEEIESLYKVIFKFTAEMNKNNQESAFNEHDLLGSALMEHYPRCDLHELHQRVRTVLRWIQTRSHMKLLGALLHSEVLNQISVNSNEFLYKFMSTIKRIELYWDKKEEYEKLYTSSDAVSNGVIPTKVREYRGCSWSQFLVLFSLFMQQRCEDIAFHAFRIENPNVPLPSGTGDDILSLQSYQSGDAMSAKSFDVSLPDRAKDQHHRMISSQSLARLSSPSRPLTGQLMQMGRHGAKDESILIHVRKDSGKIPFDSRMSEYRMDCLLRRMARVDIDFPKELDLDFAKGLIPTRDNSLGGGNYYGGDMPELLENSLADSSGQKDDQHSHVSDSSFVAGLEYNGVPLPSRPVPLQRGMTAKFQLVRSTSKLSKLLTDGAVADVNTTPHGKKHAMFASGKSSRSLLSSSANALPSMQSQRSMRNLTVAEDDSNRPAPPISKGFSRGATLRDLNNNNNSSSSNNNNNSFGHNLTTVKENAQGDSSSHPHGVLMRSPSKGDVLHTSNKHLQRSPSSASILSNGEHRPQQMSARLGSASQLASSGAKTLSLAHPRTADSTLSKRGAGLASPMKTSTTALNTPAVSHRGDDDSENVDDLDFDDASGNGKRPNTQELKSIDFHRICALCELRLPRASVDFKVMRKHVVKLKASWDPKLVSKEVRQLDNTISMYNLVYVCAFCSQYFDPDFPDGIAYPQRIPSYKVHPSSSSLPSSDPAGEPTAELTLIAAVSDNANDPSLLPYYDVRYTANNVDVGEVFRRPETVDSRKRANRAVEVARTFGHSGIATALTTADSPQKS